MRKYLVAMLFAVCSMPVWAGGNYGCTVQASNGSYHAQGTGINGNEACRDAARQIIEEIIAGFAATGQTVSGTPYPLESDVCTSGSCTQGNPVGTCTGATHLYVTNSQQQRQDSGICTVTITQKTGGTSWGPQSGSPHTYDSVAVSNSPDVIAYYGPEDGNASIEVDAISGVNNTAISAVNLTSSGVPLVQVRHVQTSPDVYLISGTVMPGALYNLNITFSHTGGYGEYAVKMATANTVMKPWTPYLSFGGNSAGISYTLQQGSYTVVGNLIEGSFCVAISSKGTSTGNALISLPIPANGNITQHNPQPLLVWSFNSVTNPTVDGYNGPGASIYNDGNPFSTLTDSSFTNTSQFCGHVNYFK